LEELSTDDFDGGKQFPGGIAKALASLMELEHLLKTQSESLLSRLSVLKFAVCCRGVKQELSCLVEDRINGLSIFIPVYILPVLFSYQILTE